MPLYTTDYCNGHSGHVVWEEQSLKEGFVCYSLWENNNQTSLQAKWDGLLSLFWSMGFQQWLFSQVSAEHWMLYALKYVRVQHSWLWWSRKLTWFLQGEMSAATEGLRVHPTLKLLCLGDCLQHCSQRLHWSLAAAPTRPFFLGVMAGLFSLMAWWWCEKWQVLGTMQGRLLNMRCGRPITVSMSNMGFSRNSC